MPIFLVKFFLIIYFPTNLRLYNTGTVLLKSEGGITDIVFCFDFYLMSIC